MSMSLLWHPAMIVISIIMFYLICYGKTKFLLLHDVSVQTRDSEQSRLISRESIFEVYCIPTYVIIIVPHRHRRIDGRTTCCGITALLRSIAR